MKTLQQIYNEQKKGDWPDKGSIHSYIEVYEEILKPYRHTAKNILEIGLMSGESLRMWDEYFDGDVFGIDCDIKPINGMADLTEAIDEGMNIVIADAADPELYEYTPMFIGRQFDVVVEDANHDMEQQVMIYLAVKSHLAKGSIYIIEDVQDIDKTRNVFESMGGEIIDRRKIKNRYDDVLIIIK